MYLNLSTIDNMIEEDSSLKSVFNFLFDNEEIIREN
jgi:hypothetical protein